MEYPTGVQRTYPWYRPLVRGLWAVGRRIPYLRRYNPQRYWEYVLYDRLCRKHLPAKASLLWAWSQTSLYTMQAARKRGMKVLLELPASHPAVWEEAVQKAYAFFPWAKGGYAWYSLPHLRRITAEIELADRVQVLSSFVRDQLLQRRVPPEKIHLLPLGVDAFRFSPADLSSPERPFRLLYVGRIEPLKGVHFLLEAFRRLHLPRAELWLAGPIVEEMQPLLARYAGYFVYKGVWSRERLPDLYRQVHGFIFPTLLDSFGLVLLEAMACGLPVIATTHSGGPDLITEGQEGYVVPPFSVEALMESIERLYQMKPEERAAMGAAARKKIEMHWTLVHYEERVATYLAQHVSGV